jgi:lytic murein transglycosylase
MRRAIAAILAVLAMTLGSGAALAAVDRGAVERQFQAWLKADLLAEAKAAGVSAATFSRAFDGVTLDWSLPELAPPGTKPEIHVDHQAEFKSPGAYFKEERLDQLAAGGRQMLAKWRPTIAAIEKTYGVPGGILLALWARETGYGAAALPYSAIRALATEAFMGWRKETFRSELIAALRIIEAGDATPARLRSNWAGALGQPQFLPSQFLKYAVDFDRDGRRDIWNSVPDVLASMANYLASQGWLKGRGWGVEARVPKAVSCTLEGPDQGKPMRFWAGLGITRIDGRPLPGATSERETFLLMPAGRFGPAFIVSRNFYTLKLYNNSDLYALYIGHLADRIADNRPFAAPWGRVGGYKRGDVKALQDRLVKAGYDVGKADGLVGYKTRIAVGLVQEKSGAAATCWPDESVLGGR